MDAHQIARPLHRQEDVPLLLGQILHRLHGVVDGVAQQSVEVVGLDEIQPPPVRHGAQADASAAAEHIFLGQNGVQHLVARLGLVGVLGQYLVQLRFLLSCQIAPAAEQLALMAQVVVLHIDKVHALAGNLILPFSLLQQVLDLVQLVPERPAGELIVEQREDQATDKDIVAPLQQQGGPGTGGVIVGDHVENHIGGDEQAAEANQAGTAQIQVVIFLQQLIKNPKGKGIHQKIAVDIEYDLNQRQAG